MLDKNYSEQQNCIQAELRDFIPWISVGAAHLVSVAALIQTAAFLNKPATGTVTFPEENLGQVFNLPSPDIPEV